MAASSPAASASAVADVMPSSSAGDRGVDRPLDGLRPLRVTVDDGRRQRLLGEHVLEDDQRVGAVWIVGPARRQLAAVARPSVALPGDERLLHEVDVLERLHVDGEATGGELGRHVALRRRAGGDAHDRAVHVVDAGVAAVGGDHHLLAVVERRVQEVGAVVAVAAGRPRRVADEDVDLAGLQRREAGVGCHGDELDLGRVAEHAGGDHAAEVGVEADVLTRVVDDGETGEVVADAAAHDIVGDHGIEQRLARLHLFGAAGTRRRRFGAGGRRVGGGIGGRHAVRRR